MKKVLMIIISLIIIFYTFIDINHSYTHDNCAKIVGKGDGFYAVLFTYHFTGQEIVSDDALQIFKTTRSDTIIIGNFICY